MVKKTESQLALVDKIDLARTLVRFRHRSDSRRELNTIEAEIIEAHEDESGNYTALEPSQMVQAMFLSMTQKQISGEK